jgi:hypothetical protein
LAPILGGVLGGLIYKFVLDQNEETDTGVVVEEVVVIESVGG